MKKLFNSLVLILAIGGVYSCMPQRPISKSTPKNNQTYEVEYLFEHDGCKVYRFTDNGHFIYFTNCNNNVTSFESDSTQIRVSNTGINKISK